MKVSDKTVLITGGSSGIGLSLAKRFLADGNRVIVTGRNAEKLAQVKADHNGLETVQCDVTDDEGIKSLVNTCNEQYGGVDILINNAGIYQSIDLKKGDTSIDHQLKEIDIDLNGPIRMVHHFLPHLSQKSESAIVNVSSGLAFVPLASAPVYCATKAALHAYTQSLRAQLGKNSKVKIFELMPPLVDTPMVADFEGMKKYDPDKLAMDLKKAMERDKLEVTPGLSKSLKNMRRLAPKFIFKQLNKEFG